MAAALERGGAGDAQSAPPRKRTLLDAIAGDEPTLHIKVACGTSLPAHRELLQFHSTCVKGLPAGADVWDVSGLLIDGRPAPAAVVAAWLEAAYAGSSYYDHGAAGEIVRAGGEEEAVDPLSLLLFADAVGSSRAGNRACYERCADALGKLTVVLGDALRPVSMKLDGGTYRVAGGHVVLYTGASVGECSGAQERLELRAQVASQLERRLYAAYKLGLRELEDKVHAFIRANKDSITAAVLTPEALDEAVLSQRVLAAVSADSRRLRRLIVSGIASGVSVAR
jgi:hypothetical protein